MSHCMNSLMIVSNAQEKAQKETESVKKCLCDIGQIEITIFWSW